ncbi:MAG: hypothetical protein HOV96_15375 [Nonomuraea sp.]|nr:hypothetical protein [Nonomuraea sp.]NUP68887.1 hypothetical protein [Nonomuraea sp.]NUP78919.1 hypothetical protein [Nonomuraea sp.]
MFVPRRLFRLAAGATAGYLLAVRPWHLRWGATDDETREELPGDDLVPLPQLQATRAVTVEAPPAAVWTQVIGLGGYRRPGAPRPAEPANAPRDLKAGDAMEGSGFVVERIEAPYSLVLADRGADATTSCSVVLRETDGGTRLIYRLRMRGEPTVRGAAYVAMMDVADFVAMRGQLLAVKSKAEAVR